MENRVINHHYLKEFAKAVFLKMGCSEEDSEQATEVLVSSDLRGIDSHGVARLSGYVRLWEANRINARPSMKLVHQTPSTGVVDADGALGLVAGPFAMKIAIEKAQNSGTGWVAVKHSNHFGIAGYHSLLAAEKDMIGLSMTNASPLVAPTFSTQRLLGTNPIAIAIPSKSYPTFLGDFATTTAANGKLEILQRANKNAPDGWIQDKEGFNTNDPHALKGGGALVPLGSDREHGSHKGYILGAWVDIFSGVLSGANFGPWVPPFVSFLKPPDDPVGQGIGHFFGAMSIDAFRPKEEFLEAMDLWIKTFKEANAKKGADRVIIPGEPELEFEKERLKNGIPVVESVVKDLRELAEKLGLEFRPY